MNKLMVVTSILLAMFLGWYFGYAAGVKNQVYFDAVAKASLYDKAASLSKEDAHEILEDFLFKQKCILSSDFNDNTYTVKHPIHNEVLAYYNANLKRICGDSGCKCQVTESIEETIGDIH